MRTTYEHPKHAAARKAREVAPLIDLTGWRNLPAVPPSLPGQVFIPGFERTVTKAERQTIREAKQGRLF